jgi:transposase
MELILTESQLSLLKELQRNTTDRTTYQKLTTLLMLHKQYPVVEIADTLGIDASTVYRHHHQYVQSTDFDRYLQSHYKPYQGKLTAQQLQQVKTYVETNLCQDCLPVKDYIWQTFGVEYTPDGLTALLHRLDFVYKKTKLIPSKADADKQEQFVTEFRTLEEKLPEDELILFADGVHPHHNTQATYAWIQKGKEREIFSNTGRVRVNINGAINPYAPTQVITHECATIDAATTIVFLQCIEKAYGHKKTIHLFVDNARYYRSRLVQDYLSNSRILMRFLPPYSPNLNPIERLWKFLKKQVIKSNYTPDPEIFKQRIRHFFAHIDQYSEQLHSLINTNFQKLKPKDSLLQTTFI